MSTNDPGNNNDTKQIPSTNDDGDQLLEDDDLKTVSGGLGSSPASFADPTCVSQF